MKSSQAEWWRNFFTGLTVDLWRQAIPEELTRSEADFLEEIFRLPPRSEILDVPCGNGRLSIELAARGYVITGVDISGEFLAEARSTAEQSQLKIAFEEREMRDLPWAGRFDGVFCFGSSFGFLDDKGNLDFLRAVARTMKVRRRFVLDASKVSEIVLPRFQKREETQIGDILFLEENRYDPTDGRMITEYTFVRDDKVEKRTGSERIYTYREVCQLLQDAGLAVTATYGSLNQEPFSLGSQRLYIVAENTKT
jgi:SAM-dependent methyltransferase